MHFTHDHLSPESETTLPDTSVAAGLIQIGRLTIDLAGRSVFVDDEEIVLTTGEYEVLLLIASQAGKVVTREEMCRAILGIEYDGLNRAVDIRVARLRKKLGEPGRSARMVKSIYGVGYLFAVE
ncbi:MAG: winged helix-turn-helix domain-containing protein [bacterium]